LKRFITTFKSDDISLFKKKLFKWSENSETSICLDSNNYPERLGNFDTILAVDPYSKLPFTKNKSLEKLDDYLSKTQDWIFGYFSYDLKNELEDLESNNNSVFILPNLFFFQPKKIWFIKSGNIEAHYLSESEIKHDWDEINYQKIDDNFNKTDIKLIPRLSKSQYEEKIKKLLYHINRGDIYEANFCMEWFSNNSLILPHKVYEKLNNISKNPMSAFFKHNDIYLLSSSPERYIKRINNRIITQPIKGTSRRDSDKLIDLYLKNQLNLDPKERSENIMIVDLVRNDLSRFSLPGSVKVTELCKVYPFEKVHQMISTVESQIDSKLRVTDIIKSTFPMGSMTGAPKIQALKIIDNLEVSKRGLYSGAIGYIDPSGNFDFNVVIRSLIYDLKNKYLSFHVGSAITSNSSPNKEYEECLLKAEPMLSIL
jgi:para-aminobenzoate synthetase component 1|tara:strand:+ start:9538 stop:10818 length:1281 start_codon:yes stop_codon:yes gene_type:complete